MNQPRRSSRDGPQSSVHRGPIRLALRRAGGLSAGAGSCWRPPTACPAATRSVAATRPGWSTWFARPSSRSTGSPPSATPWWPRSTTTTAAPPAPTRRWLPSPTRAPGWPSTPALTPVRGPGLVVTLNDAQRDAEGRFPRDASPDDLVVHQQDIEAVLNALWSAGAEGIQMQDQRIIGTSAPRCVGNTLLLNGRTYSPPYVITAIGDPRDAGRARRVAVGHAVQAVRGAVRARLYRGAAGRGGSGGAQRAGPDAVRQAARALSATEPHHVVSTGACRFQVGKDRRNHVGPISLTSPDRSTSRQLRSPRCQSTNASDRASIVRRAPRRDRCSRPRRRRARPAASTAGCLDARRGR